MGAIIGQFSENIYYFTQINLYHLVLYVENVGVDFLKTFLFAFLHATLSVRQG